MGCVSIAIYDDIWNKVKKIPLVKKVVDTTAESVEVIVTGTTSLLSDMATVLGKINPIEWEDVTSRASQSSITALNNLLTLTKAGVDSIYTISLDIQNTLFPNLEEDVDDLWSRILTSSGISDLLTDIIAYFPTVSIDDAYRLLLWLKTQITSVVRVTPSGSRYVDLGKVTKDLASEIADEFSIPEFRAIVTKAKLDPEATFPEIKVYSKYNIEINLSGGWTNFFTMNLLGIMWWPLFLNDPYIPLSENINPTDGVTSLITGTNTGFYLSDGIGEFAVLGLIGVACWLSPGLGIRVINYLSTLGNQSCLNAVDRLKAVHHTTCESDE